MTDDGERALDASVSPGRILAGHAQGEIGDSFHDAGSTAPLLARMGPLGRDESVMPSQDRVGRDDRGVLGEYLPTELLPADREPASLVIGEPEPTSTDLPAKGPVLLAHELDHLELLSVDPARDERDEVEEGRDPLGHAGGR